MKSSEFRQIIAELANITNSEEKKAKAYSIECKLQSSVYRSEISVKEYSELIALLCSVGAGKGVV